MHEPAGGTKRKRSSSNVHQRLFDRQLDAALPRTFVKRSSQERFSHFSKRLSLDLRKHFSPFLTGRHRVLELCAAEGLILGLAENGICAAFDMQTGSLKCILNRDHNEVVRSLFHNKRNATLIAVSVFAADQYSCLRCRSTPFSSLRAGKCTPAIDLFPRESLRWPGFVEFDDVNGKVLTFSADCSTYKVWSMVDPSIVLYEFKEDSVATGISEIKISPGIMLLVCHRPKDDVYLPLRLLSIEDGSVLRTIRQPLRKDRNGNVSEIEVIEQFNENLLLKQKGFNLMIIDLLTSAVTKLKDSHFRTPAAFIFLYENLSFLAFKENTVTVWNFKGELLSSFEDHRLCLPEAGIEHTSIIYVTQSQDVIISLPGSGSGSSPGPGASIHVSNIITGRCLARIDPRSRLPPTQGGHQPLPELESADAEHSHITALCYNEETGDIITGNEHGRIEVWSN